MEDPCAEDTPVADKVEGAEVFRHGDGTTSAPGGVGGFRAARPKALSRHATDNPDNMRSQTDAGKYTFTSQPSYGEDRKGKRKSFFGLQARRTLAFGCKMTGVTAESLPDLIDRIGFGRGQFLTFIILMGYPISEGSELISMTGISKSLQDDWHLTDLETGLLVSWSIIGMFAGTIYAGKLADLRGRRFAILLSYFSMCMSAGFVTFAHGFWSMSFLRFVGGFASALGVPAAISMITEMSPSDWRPILFAVYALMVVVGQIFACIGFCIWMPHLQSDDPHAWRTVADWCSLPSVVFLILSVVRMQESAHWLLIEGRTDEAQKVLMDMATKNGHPNIAKELVAFAGKKPSKKAQKKKEEQWSQHYHQEFALLWAHPEFRVTLVCFVLLCYIAHITTFGMDCLWPRLMMEESQEWHHEQYAALGLTGLRAGGLMSCIITYAMVATPLGVKLGHRFAILASGGIAAVLTVFLSVQHILMPEGQFLIVCSLIMIFSNILYAAVIEFLAESFPTEIRGTANGLCIGMGRLASMAAPLVLAIADETPLLVTVALSLFPGTCAVLPLKEHYGEDLEDYIEDKELDFGNKSLRSVPEESGDETSCDGSEMSEPEPESEEETEDDYDGIFGKATLGARVELLIMIMGLGCLQGLATCYYLSSGGYFINQTQSTTIFTFQLVSVFGAAFLTLGFLWGFSCFDDIGMNATLLFRVVIGGIIMSVVVLLTVFADTTVHVVCIGCVIGVLGASILACGVDVGAKIHPRALPWVYAGMAIGAFEMQGTDRLIGFGPGSAIETRLIYFGVGVACCLGLAIFYWTFPGPIIRFDEFCAFTQWSGRTPTSRMGTTSTVRSVQSRGVMMGAASSRGGAQLVDEDWPRGTWPWLILAYVNVVVWNASTYFLVSQLPFFGKPSDTQTMYFCQVIGDCLGRFIAVGLLGAEDSKPPAPERDDDDDGDGVDDELDVVNENSSLPWKEMGLVTLAGFAGSAIAVLCALALAFPQNSGLQSFRFEEHSLKFIIFVCCCLSGVAESSQVVIVPLSMPKPAQKSIVRKHVLLRFAAVACAAGLGVYLQQFQSTQVTIVETAPEPKSHEADAGGHSHLQLNQNSTRFQPGALTLLESLSVHGHYPQLRDDYHRRPLIRTERSSHFPTRLDVQITPGGRMYGDE